MSNKFGYIGKDGPIQSFANLPKKYIYKISKAAGGIVTYDNVHTTHLFISDGTFRVSNTIGYLEAEVFVIGGGGGGGSSGNATNAYASGGGGGGLAYKVMTLSSDTDYSITVGSGGAGGVGYSGTGSNGGASNFASLLNANGGSGGSVGSGGSGGSASGGTLNATGGSVVLVHQHLHQLLQAVR